MASKRSIVTPIFFATSAPSNMFSQSSQPDPTAIAAVNGRHEDGSFPLTILEQARQEPIGGSFAVVDGPHHRFLLQLGSVVVENPVHSDSGYAPYISRYACVPHASGSNDVHSSKAETMGWRPLAEVDQSDVPPATGSLVYKASNEDFLSFSLDGDDCPPLYVGHHPFDKNLVMSLRCRDSSDWNGGGWGDGKFTAIFGRNNSGKTIILLMWLAAQLTKHPNQGCLIPDLAGDISKESGHSKGDFSFNFHELVEGFESISFSELFITDERTFAEQVAAYLRAANLVASPGKVQPTADLIADALRDRLDGSGITIEEFFEAGRANVAQAYGLVLDKKTGQHKPSSSGEAAQKKFETIRPSQETLFKTMISDLVTGDMSVKDLCEAYLNEKSRYILKMLGAVSVSDILMREIISQTYSVITEQYKRDNAKTVNSILVLDEAPNYVGEGSSSDVTKMLIKSVKEVRKMGLSIAFVSQSIAGFSKEVLRECHTKLYGANLGVGVDGGHMEQDLGKSGYDLYRRLSVRYSYFWLATGDMVNLDSGKALIPFIPWGGDVNAKLIEMNPAIWGDELEDRAMELIELEAEAERGK